MSLTRPLKVAVGTSLFTGCLSALGVVFFIRAYQRFAPLQEGVRVEWSGFVVPFVFNVAILIVSAVCFFGILLAPARHVRTVAFSFAVGVLVIAVVRWGLIALGVLRFPELAGLAMGMLWLAYFGGLAYALRPSNSFNRTPLCRSGDSERSCGGAA